MSVNPMSTNLMPVQMDIEELADAVGGQCFSSTSGISFFGIGADTREDLKGKLFVPFVGDNFDAHDFLSKAVDAGAVAILAERGREQIQDHLGRVAFIEVENTLAAFQKLANYWRKKLQTKVVAITGSNGKTTTKEFAASLLENYQKTSWSKQSFNNHWGVPISLLSMESQHECALIEMGMNHFGELEKLVEIAEPDIVLCTMVGATHIGMLGGIDGVARAKEEIYNSAAATAIRIYNLDNKYTREMYERGLEKWPDSKKVTFSEDRDDVDVRIKLTQLKLNELVVEGSIGGVRGQVEVPIFGSHNITNLMAVASIGLALKIDPSDIWQGLRRCKNAWGRGGWLEHPSGAKVLFDGYNASPESMGALLNTLSSLESDPGSGWLKGAKKYAVLGEMMELGDQTEKEHRILAERIHSMGFDGVWFVGSSGEVFGRQMRDLGFSKKLLISSSYEESLALEIASVLDTDDIVVVKGSRGVALERVLGCWGLSAGKK